MDINHIRTRWAAVGAAVAITLGAGGIGLVSATSPSDAVTYVPITPCRLADTRAGDDNVGPREEPIGPTETLVIMAEGNNGDCVGIPTTATGLGLNVTALGATERSFLTIWGAGDRPTASNLNPIPGAPPIPNAVTTGLTADGKINIYNNAGTVNVIVDIAGYYTDHNHDDRYYTEAESDARYLAISQDSQAAIDGEDTFNDVGGTDEILATVTVDTPTSGYVVLNSSVTLYGFNNAFSGARCSITSGTAIDSTALQQAYADGNTRQMISGTRGFQINKAFLFSPDESTYNLVCDGIGGQPRLEDPQLTAIFVPDPDAFGLIILPLP